jgi:hypothetical protein
LFDEQIEFPGQEMEWDTQTLAGIDKIITGLPVSLTCMTVILDEALCRSRMRNRSTASMTPPSTSTASIEDLACAGEIG